MSNAQKEPPEEKAYQETPLVPENKFKRTAELLLQIFKSRYKICYLLPSKMYIACIYDPYFLKENIGNHTESHWE